MAVLLVIIDVVVFAALSSYYYGAASQYLRSEINIVAGVLNRFYGDSSTKYSNEIRNSVEEFDKKNEMELMTINPAGKVVLSSSGFSPAESYEMPDYKQALTSSDGTGECVGYLSNSEKYMAVSVLLDAEAVSALRVVVSMDGIDMQIYTGTLLIVLLSAGILLLLLFLGLYFIRSIVSPLRQVSATARRLARGDFSVRIQPKTDDEIGELCRVFNYMADELENSETIKNDFISSVSHELRTPLTAIKGWGETILELRDEETVRKGMKVITDETQRLSSMVEELLDFSRIQSGKFTLQKVNMDVIAELSDAVLIYEEKARHEGITVRYSEPDEFAIINGDKNRLRQVFINIIDNAIKYSSSGGVVDIAAAIAPESITITVADNGCGISAADLPKVKARFYKANNTVRGSGIGLAVADEIISMHEGTLELASVIGKGTTVTIVLPLKGKGAAAN